jgi:hypothetical protein
VDSHSFSFYKHWLERAGKMFEMAHVLVIRVAKETMSLDTKLPFKK